MNVTEFNYLINKPSAINAEQVIKLEQLLKNFPYFQSAMSLYLKGLYAQDSFKYNQALKKTAAATTDRAVLFDFITSENFVPLQNKIFEDLTKKIMSINVIDSLIIAEKTTVEDNNLEKSIVASVKSADRDEEVILTPVLEKIETAFVAPLEEVIITAPIQEEKSAPIIAIEEKLQTGKPLPFTQNETYSFNEWLQISKVQPIIREEIAQKTEVTDGKLSSKLSLIDKFIEANPKIKPVQKEANFPVVALKTEDTSYLMTETLAKVYLEQKKYSKAIQAYQILILKYPEKSSFFANRISDIKKLQ